MLAQVKFYHSTGDLIDLLQGMLHTKELMLFFNYVDVPLFDD